MLRGRFTSPGLWLAPCYRLRLMAENEFNDFDTIRNDPDLAPLKGMELDMLLFRWVRM